MAWQKGTEMELSIVLAPTGLPGMLLQYQDGYVVMTEPDQIDDLADLMREKAQELRQAIASQSN